MAATITTGPASLRSFRNKSRTPSLRASSVKLRGPFAISNLLGGRNSRKDEPAVTLNDLIHAEEEQMTADTGSERPERHAQQTRGGTNPRTIIRMLATKFSSRTLASSSTQPKPPSPPPPPQAFNKEQREAALRARGLLPPLKPNKDLSQQEVERDAKIPIAAPQPFPSTSCERSAADLIKKEWEAKNQTANAHERSRLNSFRFGGTPVSSPNPQTEAPDAVEPPHHVVALPASPSPPSTSNEEVLSQSFSSLSPHPRPVTKPPSPFIDQTFDLATEETDVYDPFSRLPPIYLMPTKPDFDPKTHNPCLSTSSVDMQTLTSSQSGTPTSLQMSPSLCLSPSLTTQASSLLSDQPTASYAKGKLGELCISTKEGHSAKVSVIIEGPSEETEEAGLPPSGPSQMESIKPPDVHGPAPSDTPPTFDTPSSPPLQPLRRGGTAAAAMDKRKTMFNPFKRNSTMHERSAVRLKPQPNDATSPRLSTFSSFRKSVIGITRPRTKSDPPRLPSSPTPSNISAQRQQPAARRAVSPIVYCSGAILMEAAEIEDEESRKLTEMAFL